MNVTDQEFSHSGAWGLAVMMVVVASWILYRYLAPKSWREWAGAGLVQAFFIALYAEMYGFPLTIYLLARFFGIDRTDLDASLWSTLLGVGELGMLISMLLGYALFFSGLGLFAQGWRELYRAYRRQVPMFFPRLGLWDRLFERGRLVERTEPSAGADE